MMKWFLKFWSQLVRFHITVSRIHESQKEVLKECSDELADQPEQCYM